MHSVVKKSIKIIIFAYMKRHLVRFLSYLFVVKIFSEEDVVEHSGCEIQKTCDTK
jgi:hypothetical protein